GSHPSGGWLVSTFFFVVPRRRGTPRRARTFGRPRYSLEVGAALRARTQPATAVWAQTTNDSWRVDETYIRVKGKWVYLYRTGDSSEATVDFLLAAKRDAAAAERFLAKALGVENHPTPRVINTDKDAAYPPAIEQLKAEGTLEEHCCHRPVQYLNNVLEQDH